MKILEEFLLDIALKAMETQLGPEAVGTYQVWLGWLAYAIISGLYGMIGSYLTTYHGQPAAGSGVAELIAYLNGVNYPGFIKASTLLVKVFGVTLAVSGKLCVGKEGPLAHIGGVIGAIMGYLPWPDTRFLQNDEKKRVLIAAGSSAGVSVAFGAPIGGALFVYELSTPNTFWRFYMIWRVFYSSCVATFAMAMWSGILESNFDDWSGADVKFGDLSDGLKINIMEILPVAILLGVIGGLFGAFFINTNTRMNVWRKNNLKTKWIKPIETFAFSFITASTYYFLSYFQATCNESETKDYGYERIHHGWCPEDQYNPVASYYWGGQGQVIA